MAPSAGEGGDTGQALSRPCSSRLGTPGPVCTGERFFSAAKATLTFSSRRKEEKGAGPSETEQNASL